MVLTLDQGQKAVIPEKIQNEISLEMNPTTPHEIIKEIRNNINQKKTSGFYLITREILEKLPRRGIILLTYLINAAFKLKYVPVT